MTYQDYSSDINEMHTFPDNAFPKPKISCFKRLHACASALVQSQPNIDFSLTALLWQTACANQGCYNVSLPNGDTHALTLPVIVNTKHAKQAMRDMDTLITPIQEWEKTTYSRYKADMEVFEEESSVSNEHIIYRKKALHSAWTKSEGVARKQEKAYVESLRGTPSRPRQPRLLYKNPTLVGLSNALDECCPTAGVIVEGISNLTPLDASGPVDLLEIASGRPLYANNATHYQPNVSLMAVITPQQRNEATEEQMTSDAWLSCVYVEHQLSPTPTPMGNIFPYSPDCIHVSKKLAQITSQHDTMLHTPDWTPTSLRLSEDTDTHRQKVKQAINQWAMFQRGISDLNVYAQKLADLGVKLAGLIHLVEEDDLSMHEISVETLKAGMWLAYKSFLTFQAIPPFHHRKDLLADKLYEWLDHLDQQGQRHFPIDDLLNYGPFLSNHEAWEAIDALWGRGDITLSGQDNQLEVQWPNSPLSTPHVGQNKMFAHYQTHSVIPTIPRPHYSSGGLVFSNWYTGSVL